MHPNFFRQCFVMFIFLLLPLASHAQDENASNPLAAVNNVDLKWQRTRSSAGTRNDYFIDGSHMLSPTNKLKYELHYIENDFTGSSQRNLEKLVIKPLWFFGERKLGENWGVKFAAGFDWILDLGDSSKAIGAGADQIAPLGGAGFTHFSSGLVLIPLAQHFMSYNGSTDISTTALRRLPLNPLATDTGQKPMSSFPMTGTQTFGFRPLNSRSDIISTRGRLYMPKRLSEWAATAHTMMDSALDFG